MNSVLDIIYKQVVNRADEPALNYLDNDQYVAISYMQMALSAERFSNYLSSIVQPNQNVVIWATNCWQWAISDLGIQLSGCVSVPIYPTAGEDQLNYIFNDAKPTVVIVDHLSEERF
ncbi:MAG: AMP-binding protein, partial [Candidatus Margulisiibacteriota bacterium]